jgi:sugar lactone lactonase YvrE
MPGHANKIADPIQMFMAPGPKPNGLQAAEDGLWIIDQGNDRMYKVDWQTGEPMVDAQTETRASSGITYGADMVWIASTQSNEIFAVDPVTGNTVEKYPSPGAGVNATHEHRPPGVPKPETGDHGLEWKDGHIYIASPPSQYVHVVDTSNWKEVHRFKAPGYRVHGIAWAEEEGTMWVADTSAGTVHRLRVEDSRCYDVFRVESPLQVHGMTIRNNRLWYADDRGPIGWLDVDMVPNF